MSAKLLLDPSDLDLPMVVTNLMKGVVYRDQQEMVWRHLAQLQTQVKDAVAVLGLTLVVDESEGYAYLKSVDQEAALALEGKQKQGPVRLIPRRSLSFHVSLLIALLRKRLAEFDAAEDGTRCILTRDQILAMVVVFLPQEASEARIVDQIDTYINKVVELGFLRKMKDQVNTYEIRRILKAFVDAQWLATFNEALENYKNQLKGDSK